MTHYDEYERDCSIEAIAKLNATVQQTAEDRKRARRTGRFLAKKIRALQGGVDWRGLVW